MRDFEDYITECPKCKHYMGGAFDLFAKVIYREPEPLYAGIDLYRRPDVVGWLEITCPNCSWSYQMRPADAPKAKEPA